MPSSASRRLNDGCGSGVRHHLGIPPARQGAHESSATASLAFVKAIGGVVFGERLLGHGVFVMMRHLTEYQNHDPRPGTVAINRAGPRALHAAPIAMVVARG